MRHRFAIRDLSLVFAGTLVALYWVYAADVFENEAGISEKKATIELDEALLIGGLLALSLLLFAARQYVRQRSETVRRIAAERHRAVGIHVVLDNFGTGYSSLYHLRNFKLDGVKIDKRFIEVMATDGESASIVSALVGPGQGLGLSVIAEGMTAAGQESSLAARDVRRARAHYSASRFPRSRPVGCLATSVSGATAPRLPSSPERLKVAHACLPSGWRGSLPGEFMLQPGWGTWMLPTGKLP